MVFTREKMIRPIGIGNDVFLVCEKCYMQSEATEVFEFRAKISAFYSHLWLAAPFAAPLRKHSRRKVFLEEFFS